MLVVVFVGAVTVYEWIQSFCYSTLICSDPKKKLVYLFSLLNNKCDLLQMTLCFVLDYLLFIWLRLYFAWNEGTARFNDIEKEHNGIMTNFPKFND